MLFSYITTTRRNSEQIQTLCVPTKQPWRLFFTSVVLCCFRLNGSFKGAIFFSSVLMFFLFFVLFMFLMLLNECWATTTTLFVLMCVVFYAKEHSGLSWKGSESVSKGLAVCWSLWCEWVAGQDPEFFQTRGQLVLQMKLYLYPWRAQHRDMGCLFKIVNTEHSVCITASVCFLE